MKTIFILLNIIILNSLIYANDKNSINKGKGFDLNIEIKFDQIFKCVKRIQLSSEKEALLSNISIIKNLNNKYLIIHDDLLRVVKIFDINGKFIKILGKRGEGPGEYRTANSFDIDNNIIYVHDFVLNKIIKYDSKFNFIDDFKIKISYSNIIAKEGNLYISLGPSNGYKYYKYDKKGKLLNEISDKPLLKIPASQRHGFIMDKNGYIYHCGIANFMLRKYDQDYNLLYQKEVNEKIKIDFPKDLKIIKPFSILEYLFIIKNNLFIRYRYSEPGKKAPASLLIYDNNLNFRGSMDLLEEDNMKFVTCDEYIVIPRIPKTDKKGNLGNLELYFYEFRGLN